MLVLALTAIAVGLTHIPLFIYGSESLGPGQLQPFIFVTVGNQTNLVIFDTGSTMLAIPTPLSDCPNCIPLCENQNGALPTAIGNAPNCVYGEYSLSSTGTFSLNQTTPPQCAVINQFGSYTMPMCGYSLGYGNGSDFAQGVAIRDLLQIGNSESFEVYITCDVNIISERGDIKCKNI